MATSNKSSATEPRTLFIALGNPLRRDDGVAQHVLAQIPSGSQRAFLQLTPELAPTLAEFDIVIFIDADINAQQPTIQPVIETRTQPSLTHSQDPGAIVALATQLYGFKGRALLCRIPAQDFSPGEGLSTTAANAVPEATRLLTSIADRSFLSES